MISYVYRTIFYIFLYLTWSLKTEMYLKCVHLVSIRWCGSAKIADQICKVFVALALQICWYNN